MKNVRRYYLNDLLKNKFKGALLRDLVDTTFYLNKANWKSLLTKELDFLEKDKSFFDLVRDDLIPNNKKDWASWTALNQEEVFMGLHYLGTQNPNHDQLVYQNLLDYSFEFVTMRIYKEELKELRALIDNSIEDKSIPDAKTSTGKKKLLKAKDVAKMLQVGISSVYQMTHKETIPFFKIDGRLRFVEQDIIEWIDAKIEYRGGI